MIFMIIFIPVISYMGFRFIKKNNLKLKTSPGNIWRDSRDNIIIITEVVKCPEYPIYTISNGIWEAYAMPNDKTQSTESVLVQWIGNKTTHPELFL